MGLRRLQHSLERPEDAGDARHAFVGLGVPSKHRQVAPGQGPLGRARLGLRGGQIRGPPDGAAAEEARVAG